MTHGLYRHSLGADFAVAIQLAPAGLTTVIVEDRHVFEIVEKLEKTFSEILP